MTAHRAGAALLSASIAVLLACPDGAWAQQVEEGQGEASTTEQPTPEADPVQEDEETPRPQPNPDPSPSPEVVNAITRPAMPDPKPARAEIEESFQFGTYGRVSTGSDLQGGSPQQIRIVAHPPRLLEGPYAELDFGYLHEVAASGTTLHTRATLAFAGDLFHDTGNFDITWGARNLYLEVQNVLTPGLSVWAGSRMYRGDDIYLLDFWPLDEQNTVGGGVAWAWSKDGAVKLHVGLNRLDNPFQRQTIQVPAVDFGARDVLQLDRRKTVGSLRGEQHLTLSGDTRLKVIGYSEVHALPSGTRLTDERTEEQLPSDSGWLAGLELGLYGFAPQSYANLFVRYGADLAAFDELAIPGDLALDDTASGAHELMFGLSANIEKGPVGVLVGSYVRNFEDADPIVYDPDDVWEVGAAVRPAWFVTRHLHLIGEVNVQYQRPNGLYPETQTHEIPTVWQAALMPSLSLGRGSYSRPQLRFIYAISFLNESARLRYAPEDVRRDREVQHFLGIGAEWWFNSSRG